MQNKIAVIGAGGWGTALSIIAQAAGNTVSLWARNPEKAKRLNAERENREYLPGITIPQEITISSDLEEVIFGAKLVLFVVPAQALRKTLNTAAPFLSADQILFIASKGIEDKTLKLMSEVARDVLPEEFHGQIGVLSGPNHAEEVGRQIPSATVVSATRHEVAAEAQGLLISRHFRVYTNNDLTGVEVAGSMKNVIALAAGIADGLGFGDNTKAALMTRGLAEIARLGVSMGADPLTFSGLAGMGDLIATCTSQHSRNARAGRAIGGGKTLKEVLESTNMVVEGVYTTQAAYELGRRNNIELPITAQVHAILFEDKDPGQAVIDLMERDATREEESYILASYILRG
ncbi:MAG: NAD(P)H-dependent glycerol-3-phosphate dehydrogenase [Firmicutes bacterium]|nr:NAD(P)H-dependent glycerol-3-phosphate dehydrogenase [Bacillota bacterium]